MYAWYMRKSALSFSHNYHTSLIWPRRRYQSRHDNAGSMMVHHLRRWPNIEPVLDHLLEAAGLELLIYGVAHVHEA